MDDELFIVTRWGIRLQLTLLRAVNFYSRNCWSWKEDICNYEMLVARSEVKSKIRELNFKRQIRQFFRNCLRFRFHSHFYQSMTLNSWSSNRLLDIWINIETCIFPRSNDSMSEDAFSQNLEILDGEFVDMLQSVDIQFHGGTLMIYLQSVHRIPVRQRSRNKYYDSGDSEDYAGSDHWIKMGKLIVSRKEETKKEKNCLFTAGQFSSLTA